MVALAKASSLAAAIIAGFAAGFGVYLSGSLSASVPRQDALTAVVTFAAAVVLACAALYLENCCRVPADPDRGERERPGLLPLTTAGWQAGRRSPRSVKFWNERA